MPAYRQRVYICPNQSGQPGWIMECPLWWDQREFFQKYGDRQIDTGNLFYVDYSLLLTGWEAMAWDRHCREEFARDPRGVESFFVQAMQRLESLLEAASWVIVESYVMTISPLPTTAAREWAAGVQCPGYFELIE